MFFSEETNSHEPQAQALMHRRNVLGTLGLTGLGLLASSASVSAATSGKSSATPKVSVQTASANSSRPKTWFSSPLSGLPEEWVAHNTQADSYLRYLKSLNLRQVNPEQVLQSHAKARGSIWNSLPPKQWWNRMGYVLKVVDRIATEMNVHEVEVISAYRNPAYNAHCQGAKSGSWHQANVAADVKFPVRASKVTSTARELRDLGLFKGGVGGYWNFTHIDARGTNVNW